MIDLQDKFDELNDLPISEELLGAYIEGSLRGSEFREVENILSNDTTLSDFMSTIEDEYSSMPFDTFYKVDSLSGLSLDNSFEQGDYTDLVIPSIDTYDVVTELPLNPDINFELHHDFVGGDNHHLDDSSCNDYDLNNNSFYDNGMSDNIDF